MSNPIPPPVPPPGQSYVQDPSDPREAAIARLNSKRAYWVQVGGWFIGFVVLTIIWALSGMGYFWPIWIFAIGAIALIGQAWMVFGQKSITEDDIQREIKRNG